MRCLMRSELKLHVHFLTGIAGLGVTYGLSLNVLQATVIWNICNAENKMISVERILQYSKIPSEAPLVIDDHIPLDNWPNAGSIVFKDLQVNNKVDTNTLLRYLEHMICENLKSLVQRNTCNQRFSICLSYRSGMRNISQLS